MFIPSLILTALADWRAFILYRASDKCPVDIEGRTSDGQDSATWMLPSEALAWAEVLGEGHGVGVVLSEGCGYACIDIDGALLPSGEWSPLAKGLCARFAGAYIEVSVSGTGLHIIFRCTAPPEHSTKNGALHIEFYTKKRYIALTGINAVGDVNFDATALVPALVQDYFQPKQDIAPAEWTDSPDPKWNGPEDDEALLAIMLRSSSMRAKLGKGVTFSDLWNNNVDKLREVWPSTTGNDYDGSSADQSLANMFAFYTGNHCERMLRLMQASRLARPKWERADYLPNTILKACSWQSEFYTSNRLVSAAPPVGAPTPRLANATPSPAGGMVSPSPDGPFNVAQPDTGRGKLILQDGQHILFKGCTYVEDIDKVLLPPPYSFALDKGQFDVRFGGRTFTVNDSLTEETDSAWQAFVQSKTHEPRHVRGMYFDPTQPANEIILREKNLYVNSWVPFEIQRIKGDASLFFDHIRKLFPVGNDADTLIYYLAAMVQNRGTKATWCVFLQGVEGNGKSFISKVMERILGERYTSRPKASEIAGRFNADLYGKLLVAIEDVKISEDSGALWEALKPMIDQPRIEIEYKGVDKLTREVCFNFMLNSNHKNGIRKTRNDRRIAPLFAAQQRESDLKRDGLTSEYFRALWDWADADGTSIVADALLDLQIPDEYNFATGCQRAPLTSSTEEAIRVSLGSIEQELLYAVEEQRVGFRGGWISSLALGGELARNARARAMPRFQLQEIVKSLGYETHPGLPNGRLGIGISGSPDLCPVLYTVAGHSSLALTDQTLIRQLYETAQRK